jgi:pilus assembly protein Flp/PilA
MQGLAMILTWLRERLLDLREGGWRAVFQDRRAVTSVEYGMIALIIILGVIVGSNKIGIQLSYTFNNVSSEL